MSLPDLLHAPRIGYVLKMYPRFSETFVLTEMLALERAGADLSVYSLRQPADGRFHAGLAQLRAPVTYLPHKLRSGELWRVLAERRAELDGLEQHLEALLDAPVDEAVAAVVLAAHARRDGLTHLHAHFGSSATTVARLAAAVAGIGYSFTAHAKDIFHESVEPADLRRKLRDAAFVVTVSDYNLDHLRRTYSADADRVVRLYNGLDLRGFEAQPRTDRAGVVAVGRLVEKKGFADLLDAIALLRRAGTVVPLDIAGSGPEEDALRGRCSALGLDDQVRFLGGLPQHEVASLVGRAAVFAAPCVVGSDGNRDGLPTVLLEAQALGTPVVSTPVTGIPEAVIDGETGLLVPEHDPAALAAALQRLLADHDLADRVAAGGRARVERLFDTATNSRELLGLLSRSAAHPEAVTV